MNAPTHCACIVCGGLGSTVAEMDVEDDVTAAFFTERQQEAQRAQPAKYIRTTQITPVCI